MGRIAQLAVVVATILALALPAVAAARSGWRFHTTQSTGQYVDRNTGQRCGSKLGTYTFVRSRTFKSGVFKGKTEVLRTTIALLKDGREHSFHFVSLGGGVWRELNASQRRTITRKVKSQLRTQGEKILAVGANRLLVDAYEGKTVLTLLVTLHRVRC